MNLIREGNVLAIIIFIYLLKQKELSNPLWCKTLATQSLLYLHGVSADSSKVNPRDLANRYFSFAGMACNKAISSSVLYNSMLKFFCGPRVVQDNFSLYILLYEESLHFEKYFSRNGLVCMFYGLCARSLRHGIPFQRKRWIFSLCHEVSSVWFSERLERRRLHAKLGDGFGGALASPCSTSVPLSMQLRNKFLPPKFA